MENGKMVIPEERLQKKILLLRGLKVMLDVDLAAVYGVTTKRLNEQVKRNRERFPDDFMFRLTPEEKDEVVAKCDHLAKLKYSHVLPHAFTEHGAIMVASIVNSRRAIEASIFVVRAFVGLRRMLATHEELANKLAELERVVGIHGTRIVEIIEAIRMLMTPEEQSQNRIGFRVCEP